MSSQQSARSSARRFASPYACARRCADTTAYVLWAVRYRPRLRCYGVCGYATRSRSASRNSRSRALSSGMLPAYAIPSTDLRHTHVRCYPSMLAAYAIPSTELGYGARRCVVLRSRMVVGKWGCSSRRSSATRRSSRGSRTGHVPLPIMPPIMPPLIPPSLQSIGQLVPGTRCLELTWVRDRSRAPSYYAPTCLPL
eukprot:2606870-Rhodomonas_salina.2